MILSQTMRTIHINNPLGGLFSSLKPSRLFRASKSKFVQNVPRILNDFIDRFPNSRLECNTCKSARHETQPFPSRKCPPYLLVLATFRNPFLFIIQNLVFTLQNRKTWRKTKKFILQNTTFVKEQPLFCKMKDYIIVVSKINMAKF